MSPDTPSLQSQIEHVVASAIDDQWCSAASVEIWQDGEPIVRHTAGTLTGPGYPGASTPIDERTVFDLASLTKILTTITALGLVQRGVLELDASIGRTLPSHDSPVRDQITLRHLLTHTSGLPATWDGWRPALDVARATLKTPEPLAAWPFDQREELLADLLATPLVRPPGTDFEYSCIGFNTVMALSEQRTGRAWPELVHEQLTALELGDQIGFGPVQVAVATEDQPEYGRGLVQGVVHDESAWSLGGACGNAGLFGTAAGVAGLGEALRTNTVPDLDVAEMFGNQLPGLLGRPTAEPPTADDPSWGHSLGLRIGQAWTCDPNSFSHTGFTGTSLSIHPDANLSVVVLANKVHPRRGPDQVHRLRREVQQAVLRTN